MLSRFALGQVVTFQPRLDRTDHEKGICLDDTGVEAKVVGIFFTSYGKVQYDIAVKDLSGYFESAPLRSVDAAFVCPSYAQQFTGRAKA